MYVRKSLTSSVVYHLVPAPLGIPTSGRCLGVNPTNYTVIIAGDCSAMFSYDGKSLRETTTVRTLCPNNLISGTVAILTNKCEYALEYAYGTRGGSRICSTISPTLCLDITGYTTGNVLLFVDNSTVLFTYIYKGGWYRITSFLMFSRLLTDVIYCCKLKLKVSRKKSSDNEHGNV